VEISFLWKLLYSIEWLVLKYAFFGRRPTPLEMLTITRSSSNVSFKLRYGHNSVQAAIALLRFHLLRLFII